MVIWVHWDRHLGKSMLPCSSFNMLLGSVLNQSCIPHSCGAKHGFIYNVTGTLLNDRGTRKIDPYKKMKKHVTYIYIYIFVTFINKL